MKMISKKVLASAIATSAIALSVAAPMASAVEVSASVGAANMYYWRGFDLGGGAAISGDVNVSAGGAYGGIWASSGDGALGNEYDLYIGYGGEAGDFSYDVSLWNYNYPSATRTVEIDGEDVVLDDSPDMGDLTEAVVSLGYGPVSATYYHGLEDLDDYFYYTVAADFGKFNVKYGSHDEGASHIDLTYSHNDNVSFMIGKIVDDVDGTVDDDVQFVLSLSLPIE